MGYCGAVRAGDWHGRQLQITIKTKDEGDDRWSMTRGYHELRRIQYYCRCKW